MSTVTEVPADTSGDARATTTPPGAGGGLSQLLGRFSGVGLTLVFIAIFALWVPDTFLTSTTLKDILASQAITAILAIALVCALAAGQFDLSVGATLGASTVLAAWMSAEQGIPTGLVLLLTLAFGVAVGLVNGALVVGARVHSFIATLAMSSVLLAVVEKVSDGQFITGVQPSLTGLTSHAVLGIPQIAIYALVLAIVAWAVLEHTPTGRQLYATGSGPEAARLAGVPVGRLAFTGLLLASVIASVAGFLLASKTGTAAPDNGFNYLLPAFAAALLGSTQILPGRVNVWGAMVAVVLLAVGIKGLQLAGAAGWVTELFNGVALMIAVSAANIGLRLRVARERRR